MAIYRNFFGPHMELAPHRREHWSENISFGLRVMVGYGGREGFIEVYILHHLLEKASYLTPRVSGALRSIMESRANRAREPPPSAKFEPAQMPSH